MRGRTLASLLAQMGQGGDNTVLHVQVDQIPKIEKALGHRGKLNPKTGALGFYDGDTGQGNEGDSVGEGATGTGSGTENDTGSVDGGYDANAEQDSWGSPSGTWADEIGAFNPQDTPSGFGSLGSGSFGLDQSIGGWNGFGATPGSTAGLADSLGLSQEGTSYFSDLGKGLSKAESVFGKTIGPSRNFAYQDKHEQVKDELQGLRSILSWITKGNKATGLANMVSPGIAPTLGPYAMALSWVDKAAKNDLAEIDNETYDALGMRGLDNGPEGEEQTWGQRPPRTRSSGGATTLDSLMGIGGDMALTDSGNTGNNAMGNLASIFGSLYTAGDNSGMQASQGLADTTADMVDPFGSQRKYYQNKLKGSFEDPKAFFNSDYKALDDVFYRDLQAKNAVNGRTTDSLKTGLAREAQFQNYLNNYRQQVGQFGGSGVDPSTAARIYADTMRGALQQKQTNSLAPYQMLGQLFGNGGQGAKDIYGGLSSGYNFLNNLFTNGYGSDMASNAGLAVANGLQGPLQDAASSYTYLPDESASVASDWYGSGETDTYLGEAADTGGSWLSNMFSGW